MLAFFGILWYNKNVVSINILRLSNLNIKRRNQMFNMSKEEKLNFDIANLKQDFAIENMYITDEDFEIIKKYSNDEISESEMINIITDNTLKGV